MQVPGHAPVGVVSFAGTEHQSTAAAKLYDLAVEMVRGKTGLTLAQDLQSIIAAQFWRAVRKHLAGAHRVTASGILQKLQRKAANGRPRKKPGGARHK